MLVKRVIIVILVLMMGAGVYMYANRMADARTLAFVLLGGVVFVITNFLEIKTIRQKEFQKVIEEAEELYNKREPQNAIKSFRKALKIVPGSYEVYLGIAQCHRMLAQFEDAIGFYQKAIDVQPETHHAYFLKGIVEMQLNRPYDALKTLRQAEELKSDFEDLHYFLGQLFEKTMQFKEAIKYYEKYVGSCRECKMKDAISEKMASLKERIKAYEPRIMDGKEEADAPPPYTGALDGASLSSVAVDLPRVTPTPQEQKSPAPPEVSVEAARSEEPAPTPTPAVEASPDKSKREPLPEPDAGAGKTEPPPAGPAPSGSKDKPEDRKPSKAKISLSAKDKALELISQSAQAGKGFSVEGQGEDKYKGWNTMLNLQFGVDDMSKLKEDMGEKGGEEKKEG